jgi:hypothetical protein
VSEVLADDETVVLLLHSGDMVSYRAADGRELATTRMPDGWSVDRDFRAGILRLATRRNGERFELAAFHPVRNEFVWRRALSVNSRHDIVESRELAILEPDGRFTLIDLATGEERFSVSLDPDPEMEQLGIMSDAERLFVATNHNPTVSPRFPGADPAGSRFLVKGNLYAVDRRTGELAWKREVAGRHMDLRQPESWPFLVLASFLTVIDENPADGARLDRRTATSLLILDRDDGHVIHDAELPNVRESPRGWKADPAAGQIALRFGEGGVLVKFKPEPPAQANSDGPPAQNAEPVLGPPPPPVAQPVN